MPHIDLPEGIPGIGAAFAFRPETAKPMRALAHVLLFEPGSEASLSSRDRELIASYVSSKNTCYFCQTSHGAAAASHVGGSPELVKAVCADPETAEISAKLKALLVIAGKVQADAKSVTAEDVAAARAEGATDLEIHDTVLIAAAFCMYNRYVDGLATVQPTDEGMYAMMGKRLAEAGYAESSGVRTASSLLDIGTVEEAKASLKRSGPVDASLGRALTEAEAGSAGR